MRYYNIAIKHDDDDLVKDATAIYKVMDAGRLTSKMPFDLAEFTKFWRTLHSINALERDAMIYQGLPLSEWRIPSLFKDFVHPNSVAVDAKLWATDFLLHYELAEESKWKIFTKVEMDNFNDKLYSMFKKVPSVCNLDTLRVNFLLFDVYTQSVTTDNYVWQEDNNRLRYLPLTTSFVNNYKFGKEYHSAIVDGFRLEMLEARK